MTPMLKHSLAPLVLSIPFIAALSGCETVFPPPPEEFDLWPDAGKGVIDYDLRRLCEQVWEADMRQDPFEATRLGDPRYHGDTPNRFLAARQAHIQELQNFHRKLTVIQEHGLSGEDVLTADLLEQELTQGIQQGEMRLEDWNVDPLAGPPIKVLNLPQIQPTRTERQRSQLVERWRKLPFYLRDSANRLKVGRSYGKVASRTAVEKAIRQIDDILAQDFFDSPLVEVAVGDGYFVELPPGGSVAEIAHRELGDSRAQSVLRKLNRHLGDVERIEAGTKVLIPSEADRLDPEERGEFLANTLDAVENGIYPALQYYRDVLAENILASARSDGEPGLLYIAGGEEVYRKLIQRHTSLPLEECDPRAIHDFGLLEVQRIRSEIAALGQREFGTTDIAAIQERLRNDPAMHFKTREEVEGKAVEALARAEKAMDDFFDTLPAADCEVVRIAPHEEKDSTIAYYREPALDGSRPGQYFINTYAPETRTRYEAEVLAYHEAIPGHHLQIAIAQELDQLPLFRRHQGSTAFVEGWALYTERLCDEIGLYSSDLDRLGVLSFDAWRACRLVVDTGIHAFGWSRQKAIDYMYENTLLARNNIINEVDRYIAWPGQALAYKIGQEEILALRDQARARLGKDFDYRAFHNHILENGAVTLPSLRMIMARWLEE